MTHEYFPESELAQRRGLIKAEMSTTRIEPWRLSADGEQWYRTVDSSDDDTEEEGEPSDELYNATVAAMANDVDQLATVTDDDFQFILARAGKTIDDFDSDVAAMWETRKR